MRFVAGCAALLVGNHYFSWWGLIGLAPILSSIVGFCPLYALLRIDTTECDRHEHRMRSGGWLDRAGRRPGGHAD